MPRKKAEKKEGAGIEPEAGAELVDGAAPQPEERIIEDSSQRSKIKAEAMAARPKRLRYNGELKEAAGKVIQSLSTTYNSLDGINIADAIETDSVIVLCVDRGQGARVVGKEGSIVKMISKELGKPVKVVEKVEKGTKGQSMSQVKEVLEDLLKPAALIGINVLYSADGKEEFRVRVPHKDKPFVQLADDSFEDVMRHISGLSMRLVFE